MIGRAVKGIGKVALKGAVGGVVAGPVGAAVAVGAKPIRKGVQTAAFKRRANRRIASASVLDDKRKQYGLKAATTRMHAKALHNSGFLKSHVGLANATGFMARHPYMTAGLAYGVGSSYNRLPGSNRSRGNQNDPYLRRIRSHQQSTALSRLVGSSTGAYA